jgi:hypothetical protein
MDDSSGSEEDDVRLVEEGRVETGIDAVKETLQQCRGFTAVEENIRLGLLQWLEQSEANCGVFADPVLQIVAGTASTTLKFRHEWIGQSQWETALPAGMEWLPKLLREGGALMDGTLSVDFHVV